MKLYTFYRSSAAFRVRIALNLKGAKYESIPKAFAKREHRAQEYLAVNPQGLIPALDDDGSVLSQSLAIIEYLNEKIPQPPFLPADPVGRAQVRDLLLGSNPAVDRADPHRRVGLGPRHRVLAAADPRDHRRQPGDLRLVRRRRHVDREATLRVRVRPPARADRRGKPDERDGQCS